MASLPASYSWLRTLATIATALALAVVLAQCGSDNGPDQAQQAESPPSSEAEATSEPAPETPEATEAPAVTDAPADPGDPAPIPAVDLPVEPSWAPTENDFVNINDMTPVRGFFVTNLLGYTEETLRVAESPTGGVWPVGSLVQLVPTEAMIKRQPGFNPPSGDWEFFELDVTDTGTTIRARGGDNVVNRFGGQCSLCHSAASNQWDHICEQDHGCTPLPVGRDVFVALQQGDPRPRVQLDES